MGEMLANFIARKLVLVRKRFGAPSNFTLVYGSAFGRPDNTRTATPYFVSWLALLISMGTLFFTFFYEHRLLKIAVVPVLAGAFSGLTNSPFSMSPVLINSGNRTETVLSLYLRVNETSFFPYKGPFILKPGDALATTVELDLKEVSRSEGCVVTKQQYVDRGSYNCHISLVISALDPSGWQMQDNIALVDLKISDDQKGYTYVSTYSAPSTYKIYSVVSNNPQTYTIFNSWSILRPGHS